MNLSLLRKRRRGPNDALSCSSIQVIQQACDAFIDLRPDAGTIGKCNLLGAKARIGGHSVIVLVQSIRRRNKKAFTLYLSQEDIDEARHWVELSKKFKQPLLVCIVDSSKSPHVSTKKWDEAANLPKHLLTQWLLDSPIVLVIFAHKVSLDILSIWPADKIMAFDRTFFLVKLAAQEGQVPRYKIDAKSLVRSGIIDRTISMAAPSARSIKSMSVSLRNMLIQTLHESNCSSIHEQRVHREQRLARVEAMIVRLCRQTT